MKKQKSIDMRSVRLAIGARVREARSAAGMSQTVLAGFIGYTAANPVSKLEQGQMASIDVARLAAIARACDVDLEWLVEPATKAASGRLRV